MFVYLCYRGTWEQALQEERCYLVEDIKGQRWLCFASQVEGPSQVGGEADAGLARHALQLLQKHGVSAEGAEVRTVAAANLDLLRTLLAEDVPPMPPASS